MKKILVAMTLCGALLLSGCGMTAPKDIEGIKALKEFKQACEEAGGSLYQDGAAVYRCDMSTEKDE